MLAFCRAYRDVRLIGVIYGALSDAEEMWLEV